MTVAARQVACPDCEGNRAKEAIEDIVTTRQTVRCPIFCWTKSTRLADHSRLGLPSVVMRSIAQYMLEEDEELNATELHHLITRKFCKKMRIPFTDFYARSFNW